jgi:flagellar hook-basal body complex protein FliE
MPLDPVTPSIGRPSIAGAGTRPQAAGDASAETAGFGESLAGLLVSVDKTAGVANSAIASMVQGTGDVHEAMLALQRAETAMQLTVQVRNKLVQAYQDVMRMPI